MSPVFPSGMYIHSVIIMYPYVFYDKVVISLWLLNKGNQFCFPFFVNQNFHFPISVWLQLAYQFAHHCVVV
jgi:hypothetical protein